MDPVAFVFASGNHLCATDLLSGQDRPYRSRLEQGPRYSRGARAAFMNSLLLAMRVARYTPRSVTRVGAWAGANVGWLRNGKSRMRLEENLHRVTGLAGRDLSRLSRHGMVSAG